MAYKKTYRSPTRLYVKQGASQKRIRISQPVDRPLRIRGGLIRREYLRPDTWWSTLHRRANLHKASKDDPLEARAVSKFMIRGTLPERIVYKTLRDVLHMVPGIDFTFQSSISGGRMELGGVVADFVFEKQKIILQVQGPTHSGFARQHKDEEQRNILSEYGYTSEYLDLNVIYNATWLENWLRAKFGLAQGSGAGTGVVFGPFGSDDNIDYTSLYMLALKVQHGLMVISGVA